MGKTRRVRAQKQRGGFTDENASRIRAVVAAVPEINKAQIVHCVSQLRRFCDCFMAGDTARVLQFGYNLGRLQELCGETTKHKLWWKPAEVAFTKGINEGSWSDLSTHIENMKAALGVDYEEATLKAGC